MEQDSQRRGSLNVVSQLGRGGLAEAWLVQDQETGQQFVRKRLHCAPELALAVEDASSRAFSLLGQLRGFGLRVQMPIEPYRLGEAMCEYIPGELLAEQCVREGALGDEGLGVKMLRTRKTLAQILDATFELSGKDLAHCDIRPENMVETPEGVFLIDTDFTLKAGTYKRRQLHGPVWYAAPEVLEGHPEASSDLFSVGVSAWTLLGADLRKRPAAHDLMEERRTGGLYSSFGGRVLGGLKAGIKKIDQPLVELIDGLVEYDPQNRPNLSDCVAVLGSEHFRPMDQVSA